MSTQISVIVLQVMRNDGGGMSARGPGRERLTAGQSGSRHRGEVSVQHRPATDLKIATARPSQSHLVMVVPVSYLKTVTFVPS